MPHPKTEARVPAHECSWYPLAYELDHDTRERIGVAVWACGREQRCIKTMTNREMERKRTKPPTMRSPYE